MIAQKGKVPTFGGEICDGAIGVDTNWQLTGKLTLVNHVMPFILCCRFISPTMAGDTHTHTQEGWHTCEHTLCLTYFLMYFTISSLESRIPKKKKKKSHFSEITDFFFGFFF